MDIGLKPDDAKLKSSCEGNVLEQNFVFKDFSG